MTEMDKLDDQLCKSFEALNNIINSLGVPNHLFRFTEPAIVPEKKKRWRNITEPWEVSKNATQD